MGECAGGLWRNVALPRPRFHDIMQAAAKVGMNVRWEFRADGTIVATTTGKQGQPDGDGSVDKNEWDEVLDGAISSFHTSMSFVTATAVCAAISGEQAISASPCPVCPVRLSSWKLIRQRSTTRRT